MTTSFTAAPFSAPSPVPMFFIAIVGIVTVISSGSLTPGMLSCPGRTTAWARL